MLCYCPFRFLGSKSVVLWFVVCGSIVLDKCGFFVAVHAAIPKSIHAALLLYSAG